MTLTRRTSFSFLRTVVDGEKPSHGATFPGVGFPNGITINPDFLVRKVAVPIDVDAFNSTVKSVTAHLRSAAKKTKSEDHALVKNVELLQKMLAFGGLWQLKGLAVGGVVRLVGFEYRQTWKRLDMGAGRLIAAVPVGLYPGNKRIDLKIWNKTVEITSDTTTTENLYSTEITSSDKLSLATKKLYATETASDVNPSATLNSVGVSVPGTVGVQTSGSLGISGSFRINIKDQVDTTNDYISDQTVKSAMSLKTARTIRVEVTKESGLERTTSETLQNPNRGNTLNYLYWEILETYEIETAFHRVDLYLSVPLPLKQAISPKWLLQYECSIRPSLPCDSLGAGFDAAKAYLRTTEQLAIIDANIANFGGASSPAIDRAGSKLLDTVATVVNLYGDLSTANVANGRFGSWIYWSLVGYVAGNDLARGLKQLKEDFIGLGTSPAPRDVAAKIDTALTIIGPLGDVFARVDAAVGCLATFSAAFGCALVPPLGAGVVLLTTSLGVLLESLGIDTLPDDEGLQTAVQAAKKAFDEYRSVGSTPPPAAATGGGFDPQLRLSLMREQLQSQKIDAEIELNRLSHHVREQIYKYHHVIWATWSASRIAVALQKVGLDPSIAEHRFYGFDHDRGIVRVIDRDLLERNNVKWGRFLESVKEAKLKPSCKKILLPSPGAWSEAVRGNCDALDNFVARHREVDLAIREAYLKSQQALADQKAERLIARVAAGILDDPTPYGRADRLEIEVEQQTAPLTGFARTTFDAHFG